MSRPHLSRPLVLVLALLLTAGCAAATPAGTPAAQPATAVFEASGSGSATPLIRHLAEAWTRAHPESEFVFLSGVNSGGAVRGVVDGTLDLAILNRDLQPAERAEGLLYRAVAREPVAFAVAADRPGMTSVTTEQVKQVYAGRTVDWSALGSGAGPLLVLDRDEEESARKFGLLPLIAPETVGARTTVLTSAGEMATALAGTPGAFGYSPVGFVSLTGAEGIRFLELDGVAPSPENVAAGRYPIVLTFALAHAPDAPAALAEFVAWTGSDQALEMLQAAGYAPPGP